MPLDPQTQLLQAILRELQKGRDIDVSADAGKGNLRPRAYVASLLGPRRIAHGARRPIRLEPNKPALVAQNAPRGESCLFGAIWLPLNSVGAGKQIYVSSSQDSGESSVLVPLVGGGGPVGARYEFVLLPNEQLYVAPGPAVGATSPVTAFSIVVSTVSF